MIWFIVIVLFRFYFAFVSFVCFFFPCSCFFVFFFVFCFVLCFLFFVFLFVLFIISFMFCFVVLFCCLVYFFLFFFSCFFFLFVFLFCFLFFLLVVFHFFPWVLILGNKTCNIRNIFVYYNSCFRFSQTSASVSVTTRIRGTESSSVSWKLNQSSNLSFFKVFFKVIFKGNLHSWNKLPLNK